MPISMTPSAKNLIVPAQEVVRVVGLRELVAALHEPRAVTLPPRGLGAERDVDPRCEATRARRGHIDVDVVEGRGSLLHPRDAGACQLAHRAGEPLLTLLDGGGRDVTAHHRQRVPLDEGADR